MENVTELTLDRSKWICGSPNYNFTTLNCLGKGNVLLLNEEGYMCCLGQFALELGATMSQIYGMGAPSTVIDFNNDLLIDNNNTNHLDSTFSLKAININDDQRTTVEEKIELLTQLCNEYDIKLKVIN